MCPKICFGDVTTSTKFHFQAENTPLLSPAGQTGKISDNAYLGT
jgi:hypothetical protein